jgi:hypothetical protein
VAQIRGIYAKLEFVLREKRYNDIIHPDYIYVLVVLEPAFHLLYLVLYVILF